MFTIIALAAIAAPQDAAQPPVLDRVPFQPAAQPTSIGARRPSAIQPNDAQQDDRAFLGVSMGTDGTVTSVIDNSAAASAGLEAGDRILKIGDDEVDDAQGVIDAIGSQQPGDSVRIVWARGDRAMNADVILGVREALPSGIGFDLDEFEFEDLGGVLTPEQVEMLEGLGYLDTESAEEIEIGVDARGLNDDEAKMLEGLGYVAFDDVEAIEVEAIDAPSGLRALGYVGEAPADDEPAWLGVTISATDDGVEIVDVIEGGPAQRSGLAAGDVIVRLGGVDVDGIDALVEKLESTRAGRAVGVTVRNDEGERTVRVRLGSRPGEGASASEPAPGGMGLFGGGPIGVDAFGGDGEPIEIEGRRIELDGRRLLVDGEIIELPDGGGRIMIQGDGFEMLEGVDGFFFQDAEPRRERGERRDGADRTDREAVEELRGSYEEALRQMRERHAAEEARLRQRFARGFERLGVAPERGFAPFDGRQRGFAPLDLRSGMNADGGMWRSLGEADVEMFLDGRRIEMQPLLRGLLERDGEGGPIGRELRGRIVEGMERMGVDGFSDEDIDVRVESWFDGDGSGGGSGYRLLPSGVDIRMGGYDRVDDGAQGRQLYSDVELTPDGRRIERIRSGRLVDGEWQWTEETTESDGGERRGGRRATPLGGDGVEARTGAGDIAAQLEELRRQLEELEARNQRLMDRLRR